VNLPAHAGECLTSVRYKAERDKVIIKGTQVYDSAAGRFKDLSILDVLQIFGRAGRPGMEASGVGYICTPHDKLDHYLDAITSQVCYTHRKGYLLTTWKQHPIESK
jgi:hypothetical protein